MPYVLIGNIMKATIKIPKDKTHRHHLTIPVEIWDYLKLTEGDLVEIDINRIKEN
jgi:bifunctional DNA-binding transcriptional regulator/antitoxin component of YhaV-PrlF toxin-antitoxin module